jgi:HlyD family secretion protein
MFIVPEAAARVVRARIEPIHIDEVRPGQQVILRFSAFNARLTPEVDGEVVTVSADAIRDEQTGVRYYRAEIQLAETSETALAGFSLLPGMPVEAFVQTGARSPFSYLVKPLADYFNKAFRES